MMRKLFLYYIAIFVLVPLAAIGADTPAASAQLSADQIVGKNIVARGGLQAWRAVQTMSYSGKMDAGGKQNVQLPFVMEMKGRLRRALRLSLPTTRPCRSMTVRMAGSYGHIWGGGRWNHSLPMR